MTYDKIHRLPGTLHPGKHDSSFHAAEKGVGYFPGVNAPPEFTMTDSFPEKRLNEIYCTHDFRGYYASHGNAVVIRLDGGIQQRAASGNRWIEYIFRIEPEQMLQLLLAGYRITHALLYLCPYLFHGIPESRTRDIVLILEIPIERAFGKTRNAGQIIERSTIISSAVEQWSGFLYDQLPCPL